MDIKCEKIWNNMKYHELSWCWCDLIFHRVTGKKWKKMEIISRCNVNLCEHYRITLTFPTGTESYWKVLTTHWKKLILIAMTVRYNHVTKSNTTDEDKMTILSGVIWVIQDGHYCNNDKTCSMTPFNILFMSFMSLTFLVFSFFRSHLLLTLTVQGQ